jgi:hypothetical protein
MNKPYTPDILAAADALRLRFNTTLAFDLNSQSDSRLIELQIALTHALSSGWIKIEPGCKMPDENKDILYIVGTLKPIMVAGQRNYEENYGWWWCDLLGEYDETGNTPESPVTHWMYFPPFPAPPEDGQ